jgi:hypothetical protein
MTLRYEMQVSQYTLQMGEFPYDKKNIRFVFSSHLCFQFNYSQKIKWF